MTPKLVPITAPLVAVILITASACRVESDATAPGSSEAEPTASAEPTAKAHYLANAGVLIAHDTEYWDRRHTNIAFPPYWFFGSQDGRSVLD